MASRLYPESKVELTPFVARHYNQLLTVLTFNKYNRFIEKAIADMRLKEGMHVLDLGCGTGKNAALMLPYLGKEGSITGLDISPEMENQFLKRFRNEPRVRYISQCIDVPFTLDKEYDVVFMSFVLHGFPHEVRMQILSNVKNHLKPGGTFYLLDFSEFTLESMPALHRFVFTRVECVYAFDFIRRDWEKILAELGFGDFEERLYLLNYGRLLKALRNG